ncbi:hypothetical protein HanHA300_Chr11g0394941 [Helianthus annuus]|nr:hypothetical protein HanHA300_Chr11g0394941 [Helianthus annuus]KAJ0516826.1 hypothetical protein HanHA89_Chr11g0418141 [Helianthus annuus]KAJ0684831.1 hypothetical protein HanLR1_Chr11g0395571 [Helianthus annuus]
MRPLIAEVENVSYNLMAINSPITKSSKFFKGLVSNTQGDGSAGDRFHVTTPALYLHAMEDRGPTGVSTRLLPIESITQGLLHLTEIEKKAKSCQGQVSSTL